MDWSTWLKVIAGGSVSGVAAVSLLSRWLGGFWLGRILEKDKAKYAKDIESLKAGFSQELEHYRAQLDRCIFVTRTHFETEYAAMKEVSQCLSEVKIMFRRLHPIEFGTTMTDAERTLTIDELEKLNQKYLRKLEEWAVFLEPAMYDSFERCYAGADMELKRLTTNTDPTDRAGAVNHFWTSYRQACQSVRDRIKSLAVMPQT